MAAEADGVGAMAAEPDAEADGALLHRLLERGLEEIEDWTVLHEAVARAAAPATVARMLWAKPELAQRRSKPAACGDCYSHGELPLHIAAREGDLEVCQLLYEAYPPAALATDISGATPLHNAAHELRLEAVEYLLRVAPQAASMADAQQKTPFMLASNPPPSCRRPRKEVKEALKAATTLQSPQQAAPEVVEVVGPSRVSAGDGSHIDLEVAANMEAWQELSLRCVLTHAPLTDPAKCAGCESHLACFNFEALCAYRPLAGNDRCPWSGCCSGYRRRSIERDTWLREALVAFQAHVADPVAKVEVLHGREVRLKPVCRTPATLAPSVPPEVKKE